VAARQDLDGTDLIARAADTAVAALRMVVDARCLALGVLAAAGICFQLPRRPCHC
jgi:hypothetical protein